MMFFSIGWIGHHKNKEYRGYNHSNLNQMLPRHEIHQQAVADFRMRGLDNSSRKRRPIEFQPAEVDYSQMEAKLRAMNHEQLFDVWTLKSICLWANAYPDVAKAWVLNLGNAQIRQPLAQHVAIGIAKADPHAVALFVVNDFLPGNQQDESLVAVVGEWAKHDPVSVAQWLLDFPHDTMGGNAITALMSAWAEQDFLSAGNWISSLPPSGFRNTGLIAYVNAVRHYNPKQAEEFEKLIDCRL
jgi:hypothetical protein